MQFRGSVEHSLDDRGRVAIPAKWRASFPGNTAVITPAPEGCLQVFPEAEFQRLSEEFASSPATSLLGRRARRLFDAQAFDAELDRQGRLLIPASLRLLAALDGNVIVAGNRESLEIWNPERWRRELEEAVGTSPDGQRSEE
ncbi:MAG: division/cell wall cluster transcriptional repressor MraZ [Dehalococcoidia bacterium]